MATNGRIKRTAKVADNYPNQTALDVQVGGEHYKRLPIQPIEYCMANNLDACQSSVVRYITRFREKGGIQDLEKAKHYIDLLIEFEQQKSVNQG